MSDETVDESRERKRRNQARYRARLRERGRTALQLHLKPNDLAALDAIKSERGMKSRSEAVAALAREYLKQQGSKATS